MKHCLLPLCLVALAGSAFAATEVRYTFTLPTTDADGAPLQETRSYLVYRLDNLPKTAAVPLVVVLDGSTSAFQRRVVDASRADCDRNDGRTSC